jgi:fumarate hydratase subunit alpha
MKSHRSQVTSHKLRESLEWLVEKAAFSLPPDVLVLLKKAYGAETNKKSKKALGWILENAKTAKLDKLAICQDTGFPVVFVEVGKGMSFSANDMEVLKKSLAQTYRRNYLRPSIVDPLNRGSSSYQGAAIHVDFDQRLKGITISILPKGFGSENKSQVKMFNPTALLADIENFIIEAVKKAGPEACPPFAIGVGIGSTSDGALLLAKKSLLGDLLKKNTDKDLAAMESRLLKKINALNIGAMGLGGKTTALAVKVLKSPTHIAGLPVGINISCHALRKARIKVV